MSLHVGSSDPTSVQNFTSVPLKIFEILGRSLVAQFRPIGTHTHWDSYHPEVSKMNYESVNWNF